MLSDLDNRYVLPKEQMILCTASAMGPRFKALVWMSDEEERLTVWNPVEKKSIFYISELTSKRRKAGSGHQAS